MKDLGEASHILGIKLLRDRQKRMLGLSQASYIDEIFARYSIQDSKKDLFLLELEVLYQLISGLRLLLR